jgi:hypothetical protein
MYYILKEGRIIKRFAGYRQESAGVASKDGDKKNVSVGPLAPNAGRVCASPVAARTGDIIPGKPWRPGAGR